MSAQQTELHKEFELERMILFSDAVFAIAITLLIIEIKFPEVPEHASSAEIAILFKPVYVRFLGFMISFLFIGVMWARHLKIFKYLRKYDNKVILLNLIFIFFIVCFPFTASGLSEHIRPHFIFPIVLYISNISCVSIAQLALCYYMFRKNSKLTVSGFEVEKKYLLLQSIVGACVLSFAVLLVVFVSLIFPGNTSYVLFSFYSIPLLMLVLRKKLKKYRPAKEV